MVRIWGGGVGFFFFSVLLINVLYCLSKTSSPWQDGNERYNLREKLLYCKIMSSFKFHFKIQFNKIIPKPNLFSNNQNRI